MIVQRIVRQHGGHIELESRVGRGTSFRIRLPLHERQPKLLEATKNEMKANEPGNETQTDAAHR
jgi:chemotaxis protein histidine kinase CheA